METRIVGIGASRFQADAALRHRRRHIGSVDRKAREHEDVTLLERGVPELILAPSRHDPVLDQLDFPIVLGYIFSLFQKYQIQEIFGQSFKMIS
jgi:hypothetical protein